ncbi:MAG TPA: zf-TFIIB domain-containing protein [Polyangiaceae bacterium]
MKSCSRCGREVPPSFPGAVVDCACGARIEVTLEASTDATPYRSAATPIPDDPASVISVPSTTSKNDRPCPQCTGPLDREGEDSYSCARCRGTFFTPQGVDRIVQEARTIIDDHAPLTGIRAASAWPPSVDPETVRYLRCPFCHERMNRGIFGKKSGIIVDVCPQHGTWFDAGEIERAVAFARTHDVSVRASVPYLSQEDVERRAEIGALHAKESIAEAEREERWRAQGSELTFIEKLAIVIKWLRNDRI